MSIIMAYKTEDKLYLGADNRACTQEDVFIRDDVKKIVVLNNDVAVAFSGYGGTQILFENMIKNNKRDLKVEDALLYVKGIYWLCKIPWYKKYTRHIMDFGSRFLVAGKNRKDEMCIYTVSFLNGKLEKPSLTDKFLFPPSDADAKTCYDIYAINSVNYKSDFMQRTIKDITKISKVISPTGDIWTYDMISGKSTMVHFS